MAVSDQTIDRTVLPIRRPPFDGVTNRTLEGSEPDWNQAMHPTPPEGAPNVLLVLIDDAGFGNPGTFGGPIDTPKLHPHGRRGAALQPLPRDRRLLADAGGHADRPEPASGRVRPRGRVLGPLPQLQRHHSPRLRAVTADPPRERLPDVLHRQVAPDAGRSAGLERAVQPLAERSRFRLLLGLPRGRGRPARHADLGEPEGAGRRRRQGRQALLLPGRHGREGDRLAPSRSHREAVRALVHVLLDRLQPFATPRPEGVDGQIQGEVRRGLGRHARAHARAPEGARRSPCGHGAAGERRIPDVGLVERDGAAAVRAPDGGVRRLLGERGLERRPCPRRDRRDGRARRHARDLDLGRQRREHGRDAQRQLQRGDDAERDPPHERSAARAHPEARRHGGLGRALDGPALLGRVGLGGKTAPSTGGSRSPPISGGRATLSSSATRAGSPTRAA
jgi:hypothetical protein